MIVDAPIFHVAPPIGWVNDPNGPLHYNGRYHLFYQHLGNSASWSWGLSWGHASSSDLVHWTRHPPAINPTPHSFDSDGCFSGCAVVLPAAEAAAAGLISSNPRASHAADPSAAAGHAATPTNVQADDGAADHEQGMPVLLYTGVVLRPDRDPSVGPSSLAVSELCMERQLAAVAADAGDPLLLHWCKLAGSWLPAPPPDLCLNCFRDPFILEQPSRTNGNTWRVMIGAGIREPGTNFPCAGGTAAATAAAAATASTACIDGKHCTAAVGAANSTAAGEAQGFAGAAAARHADPRRAARGTALVYRSKQLLSGWQYEGPLCTASRPEQGVVWECPVLAALPLQQLEAAGQQGQCSSSGPTAYQAAHRHFFSISGGPRSRGLPGCVYWLGRYSDGRFDLDAAAGPTLLDLGDLLYAPNLLAVPAQDGTRRLLLWGWLSELPGRQQQPGSAPPSYAGAISMPRQLLLSCEGLLLQQPLPELALLRSGPAWSMTQVQLEPCRPRFIGSDIPSSYCDLEMKLLPTAAHANDAAADSSSCNSTCKSTCNSGCSAGIILPAWTATTSSTSSSSTSSTGVTVAGQGAVLLYDFTSCELLLTVGPGVGAELLHQLDTAPASATSTAAASASADDLAKYTPAHVDAYQASGQAASSSGAASVKNGCSNAGSLPAGVRQLRGKLRLAAGQPLQLRLLMDFSLLEVFCGDGQVMSTRLYRGVWPSGSSNSRDVAARAAGGDGAGHGASAYPCSDADTQQAVGGAGAAADGTVAAEVRFDCRYRSSNAAPAVVVKQGRSEDSVLEHLAEQVDAEPNAVGAAVHGITQVHGAYVVAFGGCAVATDVSMHALGSAWEDAGQVGACAEQQH